MKIEQIYTGCLAQGAYYIESNGEVAIIDPLREVDQYIAKAQEDNAKIKYIFETHFHADFVSGHLTLAEKTGADIIYGPSAETNFEVTVAEDGQEFKLGDVTFKVLHTPGHTLESVTYLLLDKDGKEHAIFSGDTLFIGDVGRPDLAQKAGEITERDLAGMLYDSLRNKIMTLPDDVIVYPAHGAGSACGKNMSKETTDTLGNQKKTNYALDTSLSKEEFIDEVIDGLLPPPQYFPENVRMNKEGYQSINSILDQQMKGYEPEEFMLMAETTESLVLDVRSADDYAEAHIPGSIFIGLDGSFAPWVGDLIADVSQPLLLVAPDGREEEAFVRLSRVGFDKTMGYLDGGIEAWKKAGKDIDGVECVSPAAFAETAPHNGKGIFDVRKETEFQSEHVEEAENTPLSFINNYLNKYPAEESFYIHCQGGYRSMIAASILKQRGIHNMINVNGGFKEMKETPIKTTKFVCPTTL